MSVEIKDMRIVKHRVNKMTTFSSIEAASEEVARLHGLVKEYKRYHSLYVKNKKQTELFQAKYEAQKARANKLRDKYVELHGDFDELLTLFEQLVEYNQILKSQRNPVVPVTDIMEKVNEEGSI